MERLHEKMQKLNRGAKRKFVRQLNIFNSYFKKQL